MMPTAPDPDWISTEAGSHLVGRVTSSTSPELVLRRALHREGLRYRLNRRVLKFTPDLVFPGPHVAVFVDGCYWHGCPEHGPTTFRGPNATRWEEKIQTNKERDLRARTQLEEVGWTVIRVWECQVKRDLNAAVQQISEAVRPDC